MWSGHVNWQTDPLHFYWDKTDKLILSSGVAPRSHWPFELRNKQGVHVLSLSLSDSLITDISVPCKIVKSCCVITTAYSVFIFPEKVSTDVASWVTVTVRGVGGKDGKQTFVYLEIAFSAWCLWWLWACLSREQQRQRGMFSTYLKYCLHGS